MKKRTDPLVIMVIMGTQVSCFTTLGISVDTYYTLQYNIHKYILFRGRPMLVNRSSEGRWEEHRETGRQGEGEFISGLVHEGQENEAIAYYVFNPILQYAIRNTDS